jgi:regulator of sigma E protease
LARLVIALAGAFINFVFGIFAFSLFFSITGIPEMINVPRVGEIVAGSPAEAAKIPVNVNVIAVQFSSGEKVQISTPQQMTEVISPRVNQEVTIFTTGSCQVDGTECQELAQQVTAKVAPRPDDASKGYVGIRFANVVEQKFYPWYEMPFRGTWTGLQQTYYLSQLIFEALGNMGRTIIQGALPAEVGSPVKIFVEGKKAGIFDQGPWALLNFAGIISINLAIFNVLPIPALDGGRVFLILLELVVGRKRINQVEGYVNYVGFIALGGLMIVVFAKDILEIVFHRGLYGR